MTYFEDTYCEEVECMHCEKLSKQIEDIKYWIRSMVQDKNIKNLDELAAAAGVPCGTDILLNDWVEFNNNYLKQLTA